MLLFLRVLLSLLLPGLTLVWIPQMLWSRKPGPPGQELGSLRFAGVLLIVLGAAVLLRCIGEFAFTGRGTLAPVDPPRKLVTTGLYRFARNPMYDAALVLLVGQAILFESTAVLTYAIFLWLAFHLFIVFYEEPHLRDVFGAAYDEYRSAVPRWIPRLPPFQQRRRLS
jgi:protein-S-isoprenylcysteine O-methyltransferase Ste14